MRGCRSSPRRRVQRCMCIDWNFSCCDVCWCVAVACGRGKDACDTPFRLWLTASAVCSKTKVCIIFLRCNVSARKKGQSVGLPQKYVRCVLTVCRKCVCRSSRLWRRSRRVRSACAGGRRDKCGVFVVSIRLLLPLRDAGT